MKRHLSIAIIMAALCFSAEGACATQVQEVVTPGGFTAWLVEEHTLPLLSVKISFRDSGYAYDAAGKEGRANFTAAMLTEGAGDMDSRAFNIALESHAIQLNMGVDEDSFDASVETLSENRREAFRLLGLALAQPRLDDEAVERTRRQSLSLLAQQEQEPGYRLSRAWQQLAYGAHPYSHAQLGTKESITTLAKADLAFYREHYLTKSNIIISASGDVTAQQLSELLDQAFKGLPAAYAPDATVAEAVLPAHAEPATIDFDIPQTIVAFGGNGIKRSDPDYFAAYVMNEIIGGGGSLVSKLAGEIREKRGLAYSVATFPETLVHAASWRGEFATRNEKAGEALGVFRQTLADFIKTGPSDKELSNAKQYLTGSFVLHLDSNAAMANFIQTMQIQHLGRDYLERRNGLVEAVSKQDVLRIAKRLADPEHLLVVMIGKPDMTTKSEH